MASDRPARGGGAVGARPRRLRAAPRRAPQRAPHRQGADPRGGGRRGPRARRAGTRRPRRPPTPSCGRPTTCATRVGLRAAGGRGARARPRRPPRPLDRAHEDRYGYADSGAGLELLRRPGRTCWSSSSRGRAHHQMERIQADRWLPAEMGEEQIDHRTRGGRQGRSTSTTSSTNWTTARARREARSLRAWTHPGCLGPGVIPLVEHDLTVDEITPQPHRRRREPRDPDHLSLSLAQHGRSVDADHTPRPRPTPVRSRSVQSQPSSRPAPSPSRSRR